MLTKRILCTSAFILLLTGCQQAVKKPESASQPAGVSAETQVSQLAAVVAGGVYLRQQCQDLQVPERDILLARALNLAELRGWDTHHHAYQTLANKSETLYQGLLSDAKPVSSQCAFFKRHIGTLVKKD